MSWAPRVTGEEIITALRKLGSRFSELKEATTSFATKMVEALSYRYTRARLSDRACCERSYAIVNLGTTNFGTAYKSSLARADFFMSLPAFLKRRSQGPYLPKYRLGSGDGSLP